MEWLKEMWRGRKRGKGKKEVQEQRLRLQKENIFPPPTQFMVAGCACQLV